MLPIPIGTDRPQRRLPWANLALIAANVVIFAVGQTLARNSPSVDARRMGIPSDWFKFMLDPAQPRLYQFITYQFLHEGLAHVGFNMLFLYVFGNNLNEKLGHLGYLMFYLAGGVLAGCGQVLTSDSPTLGASGAISAVSGLFLVLLPRIHIRMFIWFFIYVDVWEIPAMYFILFKVAQDVYEQMAAASGAGGGGVAYMAHISGTVAGMLIGLLLLAGRLVQRDHYDLLAMLNRFRRRREYRSIVARGYDPFNAAQSRPGAQGEAGKGGLSKAGQKQGAAPTADPRIASLRDEISRLGRLHELADATRRYLELKTVDAAQVLPPQEQLDVANQLMSEGQHAAAASAYEDYLRVYPTGAQQESITLIVALIYSRYLGRADRARELLQALLPRLHSPREREMAEGELKALQQAGTPPPS
jgi:membrane associated rhomboid family serine protease